MVDLKAGRRFAVGYRTQRIVIAAVVWGLTGTVVASAQTGGDPPPIGGSTTTSTTASSTTTTARRGTTTSTTTPPGSIGGDSPEEPPAPGAAPRTIPPEILAIIKAVKRTPANNTRKLLDSLRPLVDVGMAERDAAIVGMGRFPVAGFATFTDDWLNPRFTPAFHLHKGTDIFAPAGTPVRSPVDGTLRLDTGPVGGFSAYVTQADGTFFYMAHMESFVEGQQTGQKVRTGQVVGFVGSSGNAMGGPAHVHFQVHPRGGDPVNPKPYLDAWIKEAIGFSPRLVAAYLRSRPGAPPVAAVGGTMRLADPARLAAPAAPRTDRLAWASVGNPAAAALDAATATAAQVGSELDWTALAQREFTRQVRWRTAYERAGRLLGPLTPPALRPSLGL